MSMHTDAPFALMDLRGKGANIDTYHSFEALAAQVLFLHAVGSRAEEQVGANSDAELRDKVLARLDKLVAEVRERVTESFEPARLEPPVVRAPEVWPFIMNNGGTAIHAERWYAFSDDGWAFDGRTEAGRHLAALVGGGFAGLAQCRGAYEAEHGEPLTENDWSAKPEDLGAVLGCILTGRQYVDRLYHLTEHDCHEHDIGLYGKWCDK